MIKAKSGLYIWMACVLLFVPLDWLMAGMLAAVFHEFCHVAALLLSGGKVRTLCIGLSGCEIHSTALGWRQALFSILAGPAGSLLLVLFYRDMPKLAVCGLLQGLYNLLPVYPLDGGRVLQQLLDRFIPEKSDTLLILTGRSVCAVLLVISVMLIDSVGIFPVFLTLIWILRFFPRKIPCKPLRIKVQ